MAVGGKHCAIVSDTGRVARVNDFSFDCNTLNDVKIVDIALKWHHPITDEICILRINNVLYVPAMEINLRQGLW